METVRKVNIGGFAFTLEEEAYLTVKAYLDALEIHYLETDNGKEIVEEIEARMAELLMDKVGKSGVVTPQTAKWCIETLGRPEDIYEGEESKQTQIKKKLYRDPDDKKIGGVCSGLAAFFGIDMLWLRLGAVALWILLPVIFDSGPMLLLMPAIYIVLLICVPLARTNRQRYEMRGEKISLEEIERQVSEKKNSGRGGSNVLGVLCKIFLVTIGIILLFSGVVSLIAVFAAGLGIAVTGVGLVGLFDSLVSVSLGGSRALAFIWKLSGVLSVVLPLAGLVYGGILLAFRFKAPKWKPGLCGLILWLVSIIVFCTISAVRLYDFFSPHWDSVANQQELVTSGKTLHIKFEDLEDWSDGHIIANGNDEQYKLVYYKDLDTLGREFSFAVYPDIQLMPSRDGKLKVSASTRILNETRTKDELESSEDSIEIDTDTLKLSPTVIRSGKRISDLGTSVTIYVPDGIEVAVSEPVEHHFDKDFDCSDLDIDSRKVQDIISSIFR